MKKVGVLGGTFDPPHVGHLRAGEVARDTLRLDAVLFVPAADPPHKRDIRITDADHRVRMIEAAIQGLDGFEVSRVEVERSGPSYTFDSMRLLEAGLPDTVFYFIMGSDAFREIRTWSRWEELLDTYSIVVHRRPGDGDEEGELTAVLGDKPHLRDRLIPVAADALPGRAEGIFMLQSAMFELSSTTIRRSVENGRSIRFLVPDAVEDYIQGNRLYV